MINYLLTEVKVKITELQRVTCIVRFIPFLEFDPAVPFELTYFLSFWPFQVLSKLSCLLKKDNQNIFIFMAYHDRPADEEILGFKKFFTQCKMTTSTKSLQSN